MSLSDIRIGLRRAALVAQNDMIYDQVSRDRHSGTQLPVKLSIKEKRALKNEKDRLFAQSKGLYMTVLTVSLAAILQGWVQSSINGATLLWPNDFGLKKQDNKHDQWIIGLTNAAPFIFAAILWVPFYFSFGIRGRRPLRLLTGDRGCPLVDPINKRFGRRGAILVATALIFISSLGSAFVQNWQQLFACRVFNGIGMGLKASSTPILAAETAVSNWRGSSALCWQLW
jgi:MFS family permease